MNTIDVLTSPSGFTGFAATTFVLAKVSNRAEDFRLLARGAGGELTELEPPPVATYRGHVLDRPDALVAASLHDDALTARVFEPDGGGWAVQPLADFEPGADARAHAVYAAQTRFEDLNCVAKAVTGSAGPRGGTAKAGAGGNCLDVAEIAFDSDFEFFQLSGSSATTAMQDIQASLNAANVIYARDVLIEHLTTTIVVQTAEPDPYTTNDPNTLLDQFRNHWVSSQGGIVRDVAHLATGREMSGSIIGLAYLSVICNSSFGYGLTQFTFSFATNTDILAHELGHNWSAPHCLDDGGTSVMCGGGTIGIGEVTEQLILNYKQTLGCLSSGPGYVTPVPPNARADHAVADGATLIDVLANDFDGNCDPVSIDSFDAVTAFGGTVAPSGGQLLYTPPAGGIHGVDTFDYTAGDGLGGQDTATVRVTDFEPDLVVYYKLDETGGIIAADSSPQGHPGFYSAAVALGQPGAQPGTGLAAGFDGAGANVLIGSLPELQDLDRDLTVSAWIQPNVLSGLQQIFSNSESWSFGISGSSLRFATEEIDAYSLGAPLQIGTWAHVAAAFDSSFDVTFYVNGAELGKVSGAMPAGFANPAWYIASKASADYFDGLIDDVQVYDSALTDEQVRSVFENAAGVPGFEGAPGTVSLAGGGEQKLSLCSVDGGGDLYFVVGSLSGTVPGFSVGAFLVPLNPDAYFNLTVNGPNMPPLLESFANLNPSGHGTARFVLPPGSNPALVLATVHHAWGWIDFARFSLKGVSGPESVILLP